MAARWPGRTGLPASSSGIHVFPFVVLRPPAFLGWQALFPLMWQTSSQTWPKSWTAAASKQKMCEMLTRSARSLSNNRQNNWQPRNEADWSNRIPPHFVFPCKIYLDHFVSDGPTGCIDSCSGSGWMQENDFLTFLKHFVKASGVVLLFFGFFVVESPLAFPYPQFFIWEI